MGIVVGDYQIADRPMDFGKLGEQWDQQGCLVKVDWRNLENPIKPKNHMPVIGPLLPTRHSPIQENRKGNQGVYLAKINVELSDKLLELIKSENDELTNQLVEAKNSALEEKEVKNIDSSSSIPVTEKPQLIKARIGQGLFRDRVQKIEKRCRLTEISDGRFLIASHIKPWRCCTNEEKLDGNNGLMLSPHVDKLFDKGWISFSDEGDVLIKNESLNQIMIAWGLESGGNVGPFSAEQTKYLAYHRVHIFQGNFGVTGVSELT